MSLRDQALVEVRFCIERCQLDESLFAPGIADLQIGAFAFPPGVPHPRFVRVDLRSVLISSAGAPRRVRALLGARRSEMLVRVGLRFPKMSFRA